MNEDEPSSAAMRVAEDFDDYLSETGADTLSTPNLIKLAHRIDAYAGNQPERIREILAQGADYLLATKRDIYDSDTVMLMLGGAMVLLLAYEDTKKRGAT